MIATSGVLGSRALGDSLPSTALRVLFLHPKTLVDSWPIPVDTLGEVIKFPSAVYPVLAAMIKDLPVETTILDGYVARVSLSEYRDYLRKADVIAISCMSALKALDTELTIRLAREINPQVKIVVGGNHATSWAERWIAAGVDFVVTGEGELPFRKLIETILSGNSNFDQVPSLVWKENGQCRRSMVKSEPTDLEAAPFPDWSGLDLSPYGINMSNGSAAAVEISRGCPHRCDFCNINTFWNYKQRYKSVGRVIAELQALKAAGVGEIIFTDDNFGGDERHTIALLQQMVDQKLDLRFGCFLRGDTVHRNPRFAELAHDAGMRFCMMGIETLDVDWLKAHRKGVRATDPIDMYVQVYQTLKTQGIYVVGLFIMPPEGTATRAQPTGVVCDFQFVADLVALRGSSLFDKQSQANNVSKDMFYHDWNLSSMYVRDGVEQASDIHGWTILKEYLSKLSLRDMFMGSPVARQVRRRPVGVILERALCTTRLDLKRYLVSRSKRLTMQQKQQYAVTTVINAANIRRLAKVRWFLAPLGLRTGVGLGFRTRAGRQKG